MVWDLNIEAWEPYLRDYSDPLLIEYLKFGFPMSISKNNALNIATVVNHHSATQFTQKVDEYFRKELDQGAMLGPVAEVKSDMFHCSPLLTRPKDVVKRRVIVNFSHPYGGSVMSLLTSLDLITDLSDLKSFRLMILLKKFWPCMTPCYLKLMLLEHFKT